MTPRGWTAGALAGLLLAGPAGAEPAQNKLERAVERYVAPVALRWAESVAACRAEVRRTPGTGTFEAYVPRTEPLIVRHFGTEYARFRFRQCMDARGHLLDSAVTDTARTP